MRNKQKGFTLAELLISLMIISIVMAATIPSLSRKTAGIKDTIWHWTETNDSIYYGVGPTQTAYVGYFTKPNITQNNAFQDKVATADDTAVTIKSTDNAVVNFNNNQLRKDGLAVFSRLMNSKVPQIAQSQIAFYTFPHGASDSEIKYAGRIALDPYNIALGRGSLQSLNGPTATRPVVHNTAIGHFALFRNSEGSNNTAFGDKTLASDTTGSSNTAIGYNALLHLHAASDGTASTNNFVIGSRALQNVQSGSMNTVLGSNALLKASSAERNTVLGANACQYSGHVISNTVCIGYNSGISMPQDMNVADAFYLGTRNDKDSTESDLVSDLISGHLQYLEGSYDKDIKIKVKNFSINPYDGALPMATFTALRGLPTGADKGYANSEHNDEYYGISKTVFYTEPGGTKETSVTVSPGFDYDDPTQVSDMIKINTVFSGEKAVGTLNFNNDFKLEMKNPSSPGSGYKYETELRSEALLDLYSENNMNFVTYTPSGLYKRRDIVKTGTENYETALRFWDDAEIKAGNIILAPSPGSSDGALKTVYHGQSGFSFNALYNGIYQGINVDAKYIMMDDNTKGTGATNYIKTEFDGGGPKITMQYGSNRIVLDGKDGTITSSGEFALFRKATGRTVFAPGDESLNHAITKINDKLTELEATPSDIRLKNIKGDNVSGLKEIEKLKVKNYTYKKDAKKEPHTGVIAQDLKKIFPHSVLKGDDGYLRIKTEEIFYAVINSIKELFAKFNDLSVKTAVLKDRKNKLKAENEKIKQQNSNIEKRLKKLETANAQ